MQPQTAWIFDIDGVLTDPEEKIVTDPQIFEELIKIIRKGDPICLNTGRSLDFMVTQILDPLEIKLKDRNLQREVYAVGEKGAGWAEYGENYVRKIIIDQGVSVPKKIQDQIRQLANELPYSDVMFYDETKRTMVTLELKRGKTIEEFIEPQKKLVETIQDILDTNNLGGEFRVYPTRIAIDIENKKVGKAYATRKLVEFLTKKGIEPKEYITFGDSDSDYEMFEELKILDKNAKFVFVGGKENLKDKDLSLVTFTDQLFDKGTLEYLQNH